MDGPGPLRIGTLGAARITPPVLTVPARDIPDVAIVAVAARDLNRAREFAAANGIPRVLASYAQLVEDPGIDAVYNPLPINLHREWTVRALRAGKHVLCEKPFASNAREAEEMAAVAEETGLVVAEAFHYRHHPLMHRVKELVDGGSLGEIRRIEAAFEVPIPATDAVRWSYELSGGATMDIGCYPLQMIRFLSGGEPEVVSASAETGPKDIDVAMRAELRLPHGASGEMRCDMRANVTPKAVLRISGTRGGLEVLNPVAPHLGNRLVLRRGPDTETESVKGESTYHYQLRDFVKAVREGAPMPVDGRDAVANMRLIDSVYLAAGLPVRGS